MEKQTKDQVTDEMLDGMTSALEGMLDEVNSADASDTSAGIDISEVYEGSSATERSGKVLARKKKKSGGGKIWIILMIICLCVMGFSVYQLLSIFLEYKAGTDEYDDLQQFVLSEIPEDEEYWEESGDEGDTGETGDVEQEEALQRISFAELKEINEEIIAWIGIPGTKISYPVMQGDDNVYYLNHTFSHKVNSAGSLFMEVLNAEDFSDYHTLIYGHNMKNGSMFGTLSYYKSPTYLVAHPYIYVDVEEGRLKYQIFSCYETTADSDSYTIGFAPDDVYADYLAKIKGRAAYDTGVEVSQEDQILTLSTCTRSGQLRYLVHAKRVE